MFGNTETVRFESNLSLSDLHSSVWDYLSELGDPTISKTGAISLASSSRYNGSFVTTEMSGTLKKAKGNQIQTYIDLQMLSDGIGMVYCNIWSVVLLPYWRLYCLNSCVFDQKPIGKGCKAGTFEH